MKKLNLPAFEYKLKKQGERLYIFDPVRRKYLLLTPEEWVRQHLLHYLLNDLGYPRGLLTTETGLRYNGMQRRSDLLVRDLQGQPYLLAECKAPEVPLTNEVFRQISVYNQTLQAPLLLVSNGMQHFCCKFNPELGKWDFLPEIPAW
ncbi:MAG: type I restriction enzyme HsdR N-terminal domain-containing protein [Bacteroidetes bacterium]|nr:type I restriction enzyme HsdR N-terminal domain-containing protein [Bacteroidota bacterium]